MDEAWSAVLPELVDAYLEWHHSPSQAGETSSPSPMSGQRSTMAERSTEEAAGPPSLSSPQMSTLNTSWTSTTPAPAMYDYTIDMFNLRTLQTSAVIPRSAETSSTAKALVLAGYLGTTPLMPTLAISLETLQLLRVIRMFKASYSMESFVKLLCHYYKVRALYYPLVAISVWPSRSPIDGGIVPHFLTPSRSTSLSSARSNTELTRLLDEAPRVGAC